MKRGDAEFVSSFELTFFKSCNLLSDCTKNRNTRLSFVSNLPSTSFRKTGLWRNEIVKEIVKKHVSVFFDLVERNIFQVSQCTFSNGKLTHCGVKFYSFNFINFFDLSSVLFTLVNQNLMVWPSFANIIKNLLVNFFGNLCSNSFCNYGLIKILWKI